ncbi:aminotransferase class I/II-fold pyridoxal phosphate-dependent enzyme [Falsibacillus albus]|uniref:Aminotransferase class I/II-fold pyridoxal phosphate-dependent enzyme n=1 Tax=Falsibacillus albus TaxID=2478915 RepID=A0A3L7JZI4_9BACI|nr:aminotransferase class I/II-fold pyridoxal phosphate-dependent enzyme [Falsibacillus albus]RLQ96278.1 aminotransferase class I/II-fold pyridoxal phosphate-dependent enzyme [Falsibacillus albus]
MLIASRNERIYLSPPHMSGNEMKYIQDAFQSNWIAPSGSNVESFEREVADYIGVKDAVAVTSGTAAIHLALSLLGVQKGDYVFCSSLTFVASANPVVYLGAEPVFIDSEPDTWNMSPLALAAALREAAIKGKLPKAVVIVNLYGQSAKMDELIPLCEQYDIPVVEDSAESLGSFFKGKASGTFGKFGVYSFNGNKIITTSGGGMIVSDDQKLLEKARFLASQAKDPAPHYQHSQLGYNYRLSNILAGIGRAQLQVLESRVAARRGIFGKYYQTLGYLPGIKFMPELKNSVSNRWLTTFTTNETQSGINAQTILHSLASENIEARPVWKPLHLQPLFDGVKFYPHEEGVDVSKWLFKNGICLPSGTNMTDEEQVRIIECVQNHFKVRVSTI